MPENFASACAATSKLDSELQRDRDRGERIQRDMMSRRRNRHRAEHVALAHDLEARRETVDGDFFGAQIGVGRNAVSDDRLANRRQQPAHVDAVDAEHRRAIKRHAIDEAQKRVAHAIHLAVMIEMLGIDVGDDRDRRQQQQERGVALVGLGHHEVAAPEADVGAARAQVAANRDGRIEARLLQDQADQRGGGGLAVSARDRDADAAPSATARRASRRAGSPESSARGRGDFGIGKFHRRGDHHRIEIRLSRWSG